MLRLFRTAVGRIALQLRRVHRAWRYYRVLHYSWHLAWHKAGWQS